MSHTPGAWTVEAFVRDDRSISVRSPEYTVARVLTAADWILRHGERFHPGEERDANARLIAAAPDLLEALERCEALARAILSGKPQRDADEVLLAAAIAVAKARGAS